MDQEIIYCEREFEAPVGGESSIVYADPALLVELSEEYEIEEETAYNRRECCEGIASVSPIACHAYGTLGIRLNPDSSK